MKSVGAVLAGFICISLLVMVATAAAASLLLGGSALPTAPYLVANLLYSMAFAAVGGSLTARLAPRRPQAHVVALALVVAALGVMSAVASPAGAGQPAWYAWAVAALGVAGVLVGGHGRARRSRMSSAAAASDASANATTAATRRSPVPSPTTGTPERA